MPNVDLRETPDEANKANNKACSVVQREVVDVEEAENISVCCQNVHLIHNAK